MKNNILYEFRADIYSDVDNDSDVPTPSPRKWLRFFPLVFTSDIGIVQKVVNWIAMTIK